MPDCRIRRATEEDAPRLAPIFDHYRQFYQQRSDLPLAEEFLRDRLRGSESVVFVAEEEGTPLGLVQLYPIFSSIRACRAFVLNDLFVEERARGSGVARRLMGAVEDYARESNVTTLSLSTAVDNFAAQSLYRSLGWEIDDKFLTFTRTLDD